MMTSAEAWKLGLAAVLGAGIFLSVCAHAPRRSVPSSDLRRLVLSALGLYAVGALASLEHRAIVAGLVYAAGILICALAVWLSRGSDPEDPPRGGEEPTDERPPPEPDGVPRFNWQEFER